MDSLETGTEKRSAMRVTLPRDNNVRGRCVAHTFSLLLQPNLIHCLVKAGAPRHMFWVHTSDALPASLLLEAAARASAGSSDLVDISAAAQHV